MAGHHCLSIANIEGVSLAAVCDLTENKAQAYGNEYGIPVFTNYREMLDQHPGIDIVTIITPSGMHWEHTLEIIGDYGKHVIVEKPTFMRPEQAEQAIAQADEKGVQK